MATTSNPAETGTGAAELEAVTAASVRVLRAAIGNLAAQFGYRRGTLNEVLAALGADRGDLEIMRQFLLAHEPPDGAAT